MFKDKVLQLQELCLANDNFNCQLLQLALTQSLAALCQALNQLVPGLREKIQTSVKPILAMPGFWGHLQHSAFRCQ